MTYPSTSSRSAKISSPTPCGKPAGAVRLLMSLSLVGATLGLTTATPAQALTLFAGYYAPANWTQSVQPDGSIDTSGAPASIILRSANDGGVSKNTDITITAPQAGDVTFDWSFTTSDIDGPYYDPFGYLLNGSFTQLSSDSGGSPQSGSTIFSVLTGDVFGFRQNSVDSAFGRATTTVSNFNAPVPGPLPLLGAGAAFSWSRRLRKRIATRVIMSPQA